MDQLSPTSIISRERFVAKAIDIPLQINHNIHENFRVLDVSYLERTIYKSALKFKWIYFG